MRTADEWALEYVQAYSRIEVDSAAYRALVSLIKGVRREAYEDAAGIAESYATPGTSKMFDVAREIRQGAKALSRRTRPGDTLKQT